MLMESELYDMLNKFNGTVMVGVDEDGILNSGRVFNNFTYRVEPDIDKRQHLIFYSLPDEQYLRIPLEVIRSFEGHFDEENNLILHLHNKMLITLWIDE